MGWDGIGIIYCGMGWDRKICPMDKPVNIKLKVLNTFYSILLIMCICTSILLFYSSNQKTSIINTLTGKMSNVMALSQAISCLLILNTVSYPYDLFIYFGLFNISFVNKELCINYDDVNVPCLHHCH